MNRKPEYYWDFDVQQGRAKRHAIAKIVFAILGFLGLAVVVGLIMKNWLS